MRSNVGYEVISFLGLQMFCRKCIMSRTLYLCEEYLSCSIIEDISNTTQTDAALNKCFLLAVLTWFVRDFIYHQCKDPTQERLFLDLTVA